jgi:mono/diheme cytochrome c family protein
MGRILMTRNLPIELKMRGVELWRRVGVVVARTGLVALFMVPVHAALAQQTDAIEAGRQQFDDKCVVCHGSSGTGDGVLAASLKQQPADLTRISERNGGTFPTSATFAKIWGRDDEVISTHVMSEMPAFYNAPVFGHDEEFESSAGRLSPEQINNIISFLVTIQIQ